MLRRKRSIIQNGHWKGCSYINVRGDNESVRRKNANRTCFNPLEDNEVSLSVYSVSPREIALDKSDSSVFGVRHDAFTKCPHRPRVGFRFANDPSIVQRFAMWICFFPFFFSFFDSVEEGRGRSFARRCLEQVSELLSLTLDFSLTWKPTDDLPV